MELIRAISVIRFICVSAFYCLHHGLIGLWDFADFCPSFYTLSPLLVFSTNKKMMALYFVGEKHQRRQPFLSVSRIERIMGFRGFLGSCTEVRILREDLSTLLRKLFLCGLKLMVVEQGGFSVRCISQGLKAEFSDVAL